MVVSDGEPGLPSLKKKNTLKVHVHLKKHIILINPNFQGKVPYPKPQLTVWDDIFTAYSKQELKTEGQGTRTMDE